MTTITNTNTMSNTKREPLLSDEFMENHADKWNEGVRGITTQHRACLLQGADWAREHYEAARTKDADLIQQLVDGLHNVATLADVDTDERSTIARNPLAAAEAAGFKPSDQ
jgi:hypothetical protein